MRILAALCVLLSGCVVVSPDVHRHEAPRAHIESSEYMPGDMAIIEIEGAL